MVMWYWSVAILFWQLSIDNIVNVQCKRCGFTKTRLRHPSLHFDSLPYPTRTICRRVRTYVRSVNHVTSKQKELDHILWVWEPCYKSPIAFGETPISEVGLIMDVSFFLHRLRWFFLLRWINRKECRFVELRTSISDWTRVKVARRS